MMERTVFSSCLRYGLTVGIRQATRFTNLTRVACATAGKTKAGSDISRAELNDAESGTHRHCPGRGERLALRH